MKSAAVITVRDASKMTKRGKKQVAAWMRKHADMLEVEGHNYSRRFTGRYIIREASLCKA